MKASLHSSITPHHLPYLAHLDGLRFVALAGVLLFHFEAPGFGGGFVGVDCFLVLSGFLITRNLLADIRNDSFSFRNFYTRRFWRLYPASLATVLLTLLVCDFNIVSNIHFYSIANYFDGASNLKPLLHTWSLSLEEQFYLIWPVLLYTLASLGKGDRFAVSPVFIVLVSALSFVLSVYFRTKDPSFAFFLLPSRIYEFGAGALCAISEGWLRQLCKKPQKSFNRIFLETCSTLSLLIVLFSFNIILENATSFHVAPVILATVVTIATPESFINKHVLSNRVACYLGKLTYSAYLVHWVLFVFVRYVQVGLQIPVSGPLPFATVTFLLAIVLKTAIEDPFRKGHKMRNVATLLMLVIAVSFGAFRLGALESRIKQSRDIPLGSIHISRSIGAQLCKDVRGKDQLTNEYTSLGCTVGDPKAIEATVSVVGDSFARHLIGAYDSLGKARNAKFRFIFKTSCPFLPVNDKLLFRGRNLSECRKFHEKAWRLIHGESVQGYPPLPRNSTVIVANLFPANGSDRKDIDLLTNLEASILAAGHQLVLSGEPPGLSKTERWRFSCLDLLQTPIASFVNLTKMDCIAPWIEPRPPAVRKSKRYEDFVRMHLNNAKWINLVNDMCKNDENGRTICKVLVTPNQETGAYEEFGYTRDGMHLTLEGSKFLAQVLEKYLFP